MSSRSEAAKKGWATRRRREAAIRDRWTPARDALEQSARDCDNLMRVMSDELACALFREGPGQVRITGLRVVVQ
jgi:hypothetical protein